MTGARVGLLLLFACGPPASPAGQGPANDPKGLAAAAERLIASSLELDYSAPMRPHPGIAMRARAVEMYLGACRAGDRPSCWHAAYVHPPAVTGAARRAAVWQVGKNCLAGDAMSCRVLTADDFREFSFAERATAACEAGLAAGCENAAEEEAMRSSGDRWQARRPWLEHGCTIGDARCCHRLATLAAEQGVSSLLVEEWKKRAVDRARDECASGVARSCQMTHATDYGNPTLRGHMVNVAEQGCRAGLIDDCELLASPDSDDWRLQVHGAGRHCAIAGKSCLALADLYLDKAGRQVRDPLKARDAYETSCQIHDTNNCTELARLYVTGVLPEPVPGRGRQLVDFLCKHEYPGACELKPPI